MNEHILRSFETFEEIPEGLLLVNESSNLMYIKKSSEVFIAREFLDNITMDIDSIKYVISYYNVENNENILTLNIQKNLIDGKSEYLNKNKDIEIIPLNKVLNLHGNATSYLTFEDVKTIVNLKEVEPTEKRKHYF